jgi:hypothetical protein
MSENNKNKKYTKREKTRLAKKVTDVNDVNVLLQKSIDIVSRIKEKHL